MGGLVESDLSATGQDDSGSDSPRLLFNLCVFDVPFLQRFESGIEIVTHEIEHGAKKRMSGMTLRARFLIDWMKRNLRRGKGEDQPSTAGID